MLPNLYLEYDGMTWPGYCSFITLALLASQRTYDWQWIDFYVFLRFNQKGKILDFFNFLYVEPPIPKTFPRHVGTFPDPGFLCTATEICGPQPKPRQALGRCLPVWAACMGDRDRNRDQIFIFSNRFREIIGKFALIAFFSSSTSYGYKVIGVFFAIRKRSWIG